MIDRLRQRYENPEDDPLVQLYLKIKAENSKKPPQK